MCNRACSVVTQMVKNINLETFYKSKASFSFEAVNYRF